MDDAGLHGGELPYRVDRLGQALQSVTDGDADVGHATVLQLGEDLKPELRALAAVAEPQSEDVAFPVDRDPDDDVDGLVAHSAVANFDHDGVDKDDRVDLVQRPVHPAGHLLQHLVGDLGNGRAGHAGAVDLGQVAEISPVVKPRAYSESTI